MADTEQAKVSQSDENSPALKLENARLTLSEAQVNKDKADSVLGRAQAAMLKARDNKSLTDVQFLALGGAMTEANANVTSAAAKLETAERLEKRAKYLSDNAQLIAQQGPVNDLSAKAAKAVSNALQPLMAGAKGLNVDGFNVGRVTWGEDGKQVVIENLKPFGSGVAKAHSGGGGGGNGHGTNVYSGDGMALTTDEFLRHFNASVEPVGKSHRADALATAKGWVKSKRAKTE